MIIEEFEKQLERLSEAAFDVGYAVAETDEGCGSMRNVRSLEKKRDNIIAEIVQHYNDFIRYGV